MAMADNRPPRKEMLSLARPQLKIAALVAIPLILACVAVSVLQTYFFLSTIKGTDILQSTLAQEMIPLSVQVALVILLLMVPLCICAAVWVSHRIVGPLRRMANDLLKVGEGRLFGGFILRDGDDLLFIGNAVTQMKTDLRTRMTAMKDQQARIEAAATRIEAAVPANAPGELAASAQELKQAAAELRKQLDAFQITPPPRPDAANVTPPPVKL
jgi:methyl-accepting chemotaxis protein